MPLKAKQPNRNSKFLIALFFIYLLTPCFSFAGYTDALICPKSIKIKDGKIVGAKEWQYILDENFITNDGLLTIKNGTLKSISIAPDVAIINEKTKTPIRISTDTEVINQNVEIYWWNENTFQNSDRKIFLCSALGSSAEHPVPSIELYQFIPLKITKCKKTFFLRDEEHVLEDQKLECFQ